MGSLFHKCNGTLHPDLNNVILWLHSMQMCCAHEQHSIHSFVLADGCGVVGFYRTIILLESNIGQSQLHKMLVQAGDRSKVTDTSKLLYFVNRHDSVANVPAGDCIACQAHLKHHFHCRSVSVTLEKCQQRANVLPAFCSCMSCTPT